MLIGSYLLGTGEVAKPTALTALHAGARLALRRCRSKPGRGRHRVEVCWPDGRALGYLPPEDAEVVEALLDAGEAASARVTALVPGLQRSRVLLEIEAAEATGAGGI